MGENSPARMDDRFTVPVTDDLLAICREIAAEGKSDEEWAEVAADDWFQRGPFVGGYEGDATEGAFTFRYHAPDGSELWFAFTLREVDRMLSGELARLQARPAG